MQAFSTMHGKAGALRCGKTAAASLEACAADSFSLCLRVSTHQRGKGQLEEMLGAKLTMEKAGYDDPEGYFLCKRGGIIETGMQ